LTIPNNVCGVVVEGFSDAKVDQLELPVHKHKICGLQVSMHYASIVDGIYGAQHLRP